MKNKSSYTLGLCTIGTCSALKKSLYLLKEKSLYQRYEKGCHRLTKDYSREKLAQEMFNLILKVHNSAK